jgi:hypothetical protein
MSCRTPLRKLLTGSGSFRPGDSPCGRAAIASVGVGLVRWGVGDQTNANAMAARSAGGLLAESGAEMATRRTGRLHSRASAVAVSSLANLRTVNSRRREPCCWVYALLPQSPIGAASAGDAPGAAGHPNDKGPDRDAACTRRRHPWIHPRNDVAGVLAPARIRRPGRDRPSSGAPSCFLRQPTRSARA